jgi:drug/metabolite transporter (DMT)-like permease
VSGPPAAARPRLLLALLVVVWAASWPAIKIGVATVPPVWYGCLRYLIATACLFALVALRGWLVWPTPSDWRLVGVSGALQMGAYSALTGFALTRLPPGRASVLAFSTPLWVAPLAAWRLHERVSARAWCGIGVGLAGVLVIAAPTLRSGGRHGLLAYASLMAAAAAWAVSIVAVRAHRFDAPTLALAPWQALVAAALLGPLALVLEGRPPRIGPSALASLAYVGPVATAFAYWAVVEAGRHFRASTMAMVLLATPSLGLVISALALGERVDGPLVAGVLLVGAGIRLATAA